MKTESAYVNEASRDLRSRKRFTLRSEPNLLGVFLVLAAISFSCTRELPAKEDMIATAIAETKQVEEIRAFYQTQTEEAKATDTPEPSVTNTETPTDTPIPSSTPTPKPSIGMAYLPDFVGMSYPDASEILVDMRSDKWYYVALINKDVEEWTVIDQEPEPGSLVDLLDDRIKLIVAVYEFTPTPTPPVSDKGGKKSSDPCGGINYAGICESNVVYWCENNTLYYSDCSWCGGVCAWNDAIGFYCTCW